MQCIEWLAENLFLIAPIALMAVVSLLNLVMQHPDLAGPGIKGLLLWTVDLLSVLQSANTNRRYRRPIKLPFTESPPVEPEKVKRSKLITPRLFCLLVLLIATAGCSTVRSALDGAYRTGEKARILVDGDQFCRPVLEACKVKGELPCPELDRCQAAQLRAMSALKALQQTVLAGWRARAVGDADGASNAIASACQLLSDVAATIKPWKGALP
jgi:hypothetical protein